MKRLTLEEVGKLAGVSRATVSRVINNPEGVTPELRRRVERVIAETGYQPNLAARSLVSRRSNILGLIIPSVARFLFTDPYFPSLIQGISSACNTNGYTLSLFLFNTREEEQQAYKRALGTGLIDGLIVTAEQMEAPFIPELIERQIPFVYIGRPMHPERISFVDVDNVGGAFTATNHLIQLGCQRIATIGGPLSTAVGLDRREGYHKALTEHNMPVDENLMTFGDYSHDSGYTGMKRLLPHKPDAVFCASDMMAVGALQALHEAGLRVPDDVSVIGFDDLPPAVNAAPQLTTVRQPVQQCGLAAVETLIDLLETGLEPPRHLIFQTELIIRASCRALDA